MCVKCWGISFSWQDGKIAQRETNKEKFDSGDAENGGQKKQEENEEKDKDAEDKVIFVHYEQRKVMLSQLHPCDAVDSETEPPSELRQVGNSAVTHYSSWLHWLLKHNMNVLPALYLSAASPGVPHGGPQSAPLLHGQVRRRTAKVDTLAVRG